MINKDLSRYARQITFKPFGEEGQRRLSKASAVIVGVGGLGSWVAELLVRAGIGRLRIVDDDYVELTNIHRQSLYTEKDASERTLKINAAANHLHEINGSCEIETVAARIDRLNANRLTQDVDVIIDGTDNFPSRFILNDCAVKKSKPWVFAGVLRTEAQVMGIIPGKTPCLRCLLDSPPGYSETSLQTGILGSVVAMVASLETSEVIKILSGNIDKAGQCLFVFDVWNNVVKQIDVSKLKRNVDCPCCVHNKFEFIEP